MYLEHFKFSELPFSLTPDVDFYCDLKGHQEALNTLIFSLQSGEGFIKIIGEVGSGKTLLCRKLLSSLDDTFVTAYIPNPDLNPTELRRALLRELGVEPQLLQDQHELLTAINNRLLELHTLKKHVVLLIDEAQALPVESLEALRLLTNLETEKNKLLQVVLFGQPELDEHINRPNLRQLKQRITFSYYLPQMSREELDIYLFHRLAIAGHTLGTLFTEKARHLLFQSSNGIPRIVNILCHKALLVAYGRGDGRVNHKAMLNAIQDTESAMKINYNLLITVTVILGMVVGIVFIFYLYNGII